MAFRHSRSAAETYFTDSRCVACRDGLDRVGRYCAKCLRSRRLKLFFGAVVLVQCAALGMYISKSKETNRVVASDGQHTVVVSVPAGPSGWYYFDITDPLIEDVAHHARISADPPMASQSLQSPSGARSGTLEVSASRHYGKSVVLTFPSVPRACAANECALHAIFDNDVAQDLPYQDISGHGAIVLMLSQPEEFIKRLPSAHGLTLIAYEGNKTDTTLTFGVQGFHLRLAAFDAHRFRTAEASTTRPHA